MSPSNTPTYLLATSRDVAPPLPRRTCSSEGIFPVIWFQPPSGATWRHFPSSYLLFLGRRTWHPPHNLLSGVCTEQKERNVSGLSDYKWLWKGHGLLVSELTWKELCFSVFYHETWSGIGAGHPGKCYNHHFSTCSEGVWMWQLGMWFSAGHSGVGLTVGLICLASLLQF